MSTNLKKNQVYDVINNKLNFNFNSTIANNNIKDKQPVAKFNPNKGNKAHVTYDDGLIFLMDSIDLQGVDSN